MRYDPEVADGGTTFYMRLTGPGGARHDAAVFVPAAFHSTPRVDLILYLHGLTHQPDLRAYMNRRQSREIRSAVGRAGRYALAVPWLGPSADAGFLVRGVPEFETCVGQMARAAAENAGDTTGCPVELGLNTLALAAHSGGGNGLRQAAWLTSAFIGRVAEVWAFDCFYWEEGARWADWARKYPSAQLRAWWTGGRTAVQGRILAAAGLPNVSSVATSIPHDEIPNRLLPGLLAGLVPARATP